MKRRFIIVTADTILRVLQQYLQGVVPENAKVSSIEYNAADFGKIRVNYTSTERPEKPFIEAKFDLRQTM